MYTIGRLGVGYTIPADMQRAAQDDNFEQMIEGLPGVHTWYSGSSHVTPLLIGVAGSDIDEADSVDIDAMMSGLSDPSLVVQASNYLTGVLKELEDIMLDEGELPSIRAVINHLKSQTPKKWIVWSTS